MKIALPREFNSLREDLDGFYEFSATQVLFANILLSCDNAENYRASFAVLPKKYISSPRVIAHCVRNVQPHIIIITIMEQVFGF